MKLAITGKGGVGKTTIAALLAHHYARQGRPVLAIDADPSPCLSAALGFPPDLTASLRPIAEMEELIYEGTGAQPGTTGGYFKLNPRVDDLPDRFAAGQGGIKLLQLGAVKAGGSGCICPESALLKTLVTHILLRRNEVVILDMYAGVEHLGRATADSVDAMMAVVEPGARSLATAQQIRRMAADIGIRRVYLVGNKVRGPEDEEYVRAAGDGLPLLGVFPYSPAAIHADQSGQSLYDADPQAARRAGEVAARIEALLEATLD